MARKSLERRRIQLRLTEIVARLKAVDEERVALLREMDELRLADTVLQRLSGEADIADAEAADVADVTEEHGQNPPTDMTIADMALVLLREVGSEGLTSNEVLEQLRKRWLPELARTSLSPPLSRLKAKGLIELLDDRWRMRGD